MSQYHVTIREGTQPPMVQKCTQCCPFYHCPLCTPDIFKPTNRYKVQKHLKSHFSRAIQYQGYYIYKCNLGCRPHAHFHCFCNTLFLNRNQFIHHLNTKHQGPPLTESAMKYPAVSSGGEDDEVNGSAALPSSALCEGSSSLPAGGGPDTLATKYCFSPPSSNGEPNAMPDLASPPPSHALSSSAENGETTWTSNSVSGVATPPAGGAPALPAANDGRISLSACDVATKVSQVKREPSIRAACPQRSVVINNNILSKRIKMNQGQVSHLRGPINLPGELLPRHEYVSEGRLGATPMEIEILSQLRALQQQQSQILLLLQKLTDTSAKPAADQAELEAMFPIVDEEGLAALELNLSENPDLKNRLIRFFGAIEGVPIEETVEGILDRMLSNTFVKRMSWKGANNKVSFASSSLREIVKDSARENTLCARAADAAVESVIKSWLLRGADGDGSRKESARGKPGGVIISSTS